MTRAKELDSALTATYTLESTVFTEKMLHFLDESNHPNNETLRRTFGFMGTLHGTLYVCISVFRNVSLNWPIRLDL